MEATSDSKICPPMGKKCRKCKKPDAYSICSRCNLAFYCGKECQLVDWPNHKRSCYTMDQQRQQRIHACEQLFESITKKIAGNIIIMNAWYRELRGYIEVEISETLDDLLSGPSSHFLHMKYIVEDSEIYDSHSEPDKCIVVYNLKDLTHENIITVRLSPALVKEKQKQPSQEWSIMIDF